MGIEPTWPAWKAGTLPLSYTRDAEPAGNRLITFLFEFFLCVTAVRKNLKAICKVGRIHLINRVGATGFEPVKALPPDLQSGPIGRSGTPPSFPSRKGRTFTDLRTELAVGVEPTTAGLQNRSSAIEPR